jgi:phosphatidylserine decarboxylase
VSRFGAYCQYLYPQKLLSALMYRATRIRLGLYKNWQIRWFIRRYGVDMGLAVDTEPRAYPHFNAFFTRAIRAECRPLSDDPRAVVSPVDGCVSEVGTIRDGQLLQAKGKYFSLSDLLGGNQEDSRGFQSGSFATIYLGPKDYHRVHMPFAGRLRKTIYIPGCLFSVNPATTNIVSSLFARNERVVALFDTAAGPMAVILVGAIFVGGLETTWAGPIAPPRSRHIRTWSHDKTGDTPVDLGKGAEMGRFSMGSTVIVLFPAGALHWRPGLQSEDDVLMGERIGTLLEDVIRTAPGGPSASD